MPDNSHSKGASISNRLIHEKSPYLLQHAHNPVDWFPWGEEAFKKAKTENKPILLSIGYSSCHWCHVMAHESFEDPSVAKFLNENFVSIKVDREERPDVDEIYMKSVMSMTGSGGWPLTVFLTPSLEPFFGGTYFPPTTRYGMPSFLNLVKDISHSWKTERNNLVNSAGQMKKALQEMYETNKYPGAILTDSIFEDCYQELVSSFDENQGGFGQSPKFPMPTNLFFLMRYAKLKGNSSSLAMNIVTRTLDSMMRGGIYDHIGGGFHRYSTDRYWLVPHFEKMLYDNALLSIAYAEACLITKNQEYYGIVRETLDWLLREMQSPEGGFYSAIDADSPEGEGSYYVWDRREVERAIKDEAANLQIISDYFSITTEGNFENGKTILTSKPLAALAQKYNLKEDDLGRMIQAAKRFMLELRNGRPKPSVDDKILTSWNGLAISALSKGYSVFGNKEYVKAAVNAAEFILKKLVVYEESNLRILRSHRDGESKGDGVLEDYSFFLNGLIDLFEASYEPKYLERAVTLCDSMLSRFLDTKEGGFFMTDDRTKNLIVRPKEAHDGATPSGNSVAALACAKLAEFTTRDDYREAAKDVFETFWKVISNQPSSFTVMLVALQFFLGPKKEIVISGTREAEDTKDLIKALRSEFLPNSVSILADQRLDGVTPLVRERINKQGEQARAFVCSNFTCKTPVTTSRQLMEALKA